MHPGLYSFTIYQGATYQQTFTWHQEDQDSPVVDLSDYQARMQIRDHKGGELILSLTDDVDGGLTLGGTAGTIAVLIDSGTTAAMEMTRPGFYDLELIQPDGVVWRLLEGRVGFSHEVTIEEGS